MGEAEPEKGVSDVREPVYDTIGLTEIDVTKNIRGVTVASEELVASVRRKGVSQPVLVRLAPPGSDFVYEMMDGHRRWQAAKTCGHETIRAHIFDLTDRDYREIQFESVGLREDLNPIDRARALRALIEEHGLTQTEAGALIEGGWSQESVSNCIALLKLPAALQDLISRRIISASGGQEILRARKLPKALKLATEQLESRADFGADPRVEISVEQVRAIVAQAIDEHSKDLGGQNGRLLFDVAGCKGCDNRVRGRYDDRCGEPKCWKEKQAAGRQVKVEEAAARARAGNPDFGDDQFLTAAFDDCPKTCKDRRKSQGFNGTTFRCLAPDSDCYRERKAAQPVAEKPVKLDPAEERARQDAEIKTRREAEESWRAQEASRLKRVRAYLEKRVELTEDETRLLCLGALRRFVSPADLEQAVTLPLGDATRRALECLLGDEPERAWDVTLRRYVPLARPTRYDGLRHGLIGWAPGGAEDPDPQIDPEPGVDPNHDPEPDGEEAIIEAESPSSKVAIDCKRDCKRCDQKFCDLHPSHAAQAPPEPEAPEDDLAPLSVEKASYGANPGITVCPHFETARSPEACLACCSASGKRHLGGCCGHVTRGQAPFHCPGGLDICPESVGEETEEGEPAPITACPVTKDATTEAECRTCCVGKWATEGCCAPVVTGRAPFNCPGPEEGVADKNGRAVCRETPATPAPREEAAADG
jgi:ParB/RepB/Spo0J family partition protein